MKPIKIDVSDVVIAAGLGGLGAIGHFYREPLALIALCVLVVLFGLRLGR